MVFVTMKTVTADCKVHVFMHVLVQTICQIYDKIVLLGVDVLICKLARPEMNPECILNQSRKHCVQRA